MERRNLSSRFLIAEINEQRDSSRSERASSFLDNVVIMLLRSRLVTFRKLNVTRGTTFTPEHERTG